MAQDNVNVKTKTELLMSQMAEQVKQHIVFDAFDRPILIFTAAIETKAGGPCSLTEYIYRSTTSSQIRGRQERVSTWQATWDASFIFDPTVSYDPDGDGIL